MKEERRRTKKEGRKMTDGEKGKESERRKTKKEGKRRKNGEGRKVRT
jgi:hypothetical protein